MGWNKGKKWTIHYGRYTYEYETAKELGKMVRESGSRMPNPYSPDCTDYDDYIEAVHG